MTTGLVLRAVVTRSSRGRGLWRGLKRNTSVVNGWVTLSVLVGSSRWPSCTTCWPPNGGLSSTEPSSVSLNFPSHESGVTKNSTYGIHFMSFHSTYRKYRRTKSLTQRNCWYLMERNASAIVRVIFNMKRPWKRWGKMHGGKKETTLSSIHQPI